MDVKRAPLPDKKLTKEESETALRALGMYQVHLFDEMKLKPGSIAEIQMESKRATQAIKKIHAAIEEKGNIEVSGSSD
jgi:hypothetical protein